jgi:hypothetical protein
MRASSRSVAFLVSALAAGGCGNSTYYSGGGGSPWVGGALPTGNLPTYNIKPDVASLSLVGVQAGYSISANSSGNYRLVWTGDAATSGTYHEFWGSVWTPDRFTAYTPGCLDQSCALEAGDAISGQPVQGAGWQRIDWDTFAADGLDGFDFAVDPTAPGHAVVYFDLYIDGQRYSDLVYFPDGNNGGKVAMGVASIPFAAGIGASATFVYHGSPTPYAGGALPAVASATYRILPGAASLSLVGSQAGYSISGNTGGSYRLVWTGDATTSGSYHEFWGSVWTQGTFDSLSRGCGDGSCALEAGDVVSSAHSGAGFQRIDWDTFASDGLDGFDFTATVDTPDKPVVFDLWIDGQRYPDLVFFPATDTTPPGTLSSVSAIPFGLTTQ